MKFFFPYPIFCCCLLSLLLLLRKKVTAQLRKEKSVVEFISFSRILQEWNTKKLGELWKERSPYHFKFGIPPNKKKINSLKMWTLERLAPGTQSNSKTRKGKSPKRNSPRHRKARKNGIWRYGDRKETKRKKKNIWKSIGWRESGKFKTVAIKKSEKRPESRAEQRAEHQRVIEETTNPDMVAHDSAPAPFPFKTRSI